MAGSPLKIATHISSGVAWVYLLGMVGWEEVEEKCGICSEVCHIDVPIELREEWNDTREQYFEAIMEAGM